MIHLSSATSGGPQGGHSGLTVASGAQLSVNQLSAGHATGSARVDVTGGRLNINGPANFEGGTSVTFSSGTIALASDTHTIFHNGSTLNWSSGTLSTGTDAILEFRGGVRTITGSRSLPNGLKLRVTSGGKLTSTGFVDIANGIATGTLLVEGPGSQYNIGGGLVSDWGRSAGNAATINFSDQAVGTISGGLQVAAAGGKAVVNLEGSASLNTNIFTVGRATGAGPASDAVVNINDGTFNVAGTTAIQNGATVKLFAGRFSVGGNTTVSAGGRFDWTGGSFITASSTTLAFNGGIGSFTVGSGLSSNSTLQVTSNGKVDTTGFYDIGAGAPGTLLVSGSSSYFASNTTTGNFSYWGLSPTGVATITFADGAVGTFSGGLNVAVSDARALVSLTNGRLSTASMSVGGSTGAGTININNGTLNILGAATLSSGALVNYNSGSMNVGGMLTINGGAKIICDSAASKTLRLGGLSIAGTALNPAQIDVGGGQTVTITKTGLGVVPMFTMRSIISNGFNNGSWNGNGLISTTALLTNPFTLPRVGLMYLDRGTTVDVLLAATGDANGDFLVNALDFNALATNYGLTNQFWINGDFDYNGTVNSTDFTLLAGNFNIPYIAGGPSLGTLVPEPSSLMVLAIIGMIVRNHTRG